MTACFAAAPSTNPTPRQTDIWQIYRRKETMSDEGTAGDPATRWVMREERLLDQIETLEAENRRLRHTAEPHRWETDGQNCAYRYSDGAWCMTTREGHCR